MCVHRYIVPHLRIHCCRVTATVRSLFIAVGVDVDVDYIKVFSVAADIKECVPFSLLASYKIIRTAVNSNMMSGCLYSCFSYAACRSHLFCAILYCHLWPVCLYYIFSHCLINSTILENRQYWTKMFVLVLSTTFIWNISHYEKNPARYYYTCTQTFMWSTRYSCQTWWNLSFLDRFSKNPQILNFLKIDPVVAEYFKWTYRRTEDIQT